MFSANFGKFSFLNKHYFLVQKRLKNNLSEMFVLLNRNLALLVRYISIKNQLCNIIYWRKLEHTHTHSCVSFIEFLSNTAIISEICSIYVTAT